MRKKLPIINILLLFFFLLSSTFFFRNELLQVPANMIVKRSHLEEKGQVGILLMGSFVNRSIQMGKLYKEGWVKKIVYAEAEMGQGKYSGIELSQGNKVDKMLSFLEIPVKDRFFLRETRNTSTFDEAKVILNSIKEKFPETKKIILVTSWYHSSRAMWIFKRVNSFGFEIKSAPNEKPQRWWTRESSFLMVFNEYLKWVYYLINY